MYERQSFLKKLVSTLTWSSLAMLVPLASLGFLSEKSLPGQSLYPMKRTIENIVSGFDTFDKNAQALYKVYLVDRRFSETTNLLAENSVSLDTSQINDFVSQIETARDTINSVSNPAERKSLRDKLIQQISDYRDQLTILQTQSSPPSPVAMSQSTPQSNGVPPINNSASQQNNTNSQSQMPPAENSSNYQIQQLNDQLQQQQDQLQQDQSTNAGTPTPTPTSPESPTPTSGTTPTPSFTPTPTPVIPPFVGQHSTPSPSPSPTPTPTPTPTPFPCGCWINGVPFIDANANGIIDSGDSYYDYTTNPALTFSLYDRHGNFIGSQTQNNRQNANPYFYSFNKLPADTSYTVRLDSIPPGYVLTTPQSYTVKVGVPCDTGGNPDTKCAPGGNISLLDFGLIHNGFSNGHALH